MGLELSNQKDCSISSVLVIEILQSGTKPSYCSFVLQGTSYNWTEFEFEFKIWIWLQIPHCISLYSNMIPLVVIMHLQCVGLWHLPGEISLCSEMKVFMQSFFHLFVKFIGKSTLAI